MIKMIKATENNLDDLMKLRLEMLKEINHLPEEYSFSSLFLDDSQQYFMSGQHTTVLATEDRAAVGCATLCYTEMLPTFSHPTGKRAHMMNVYTKKEYRCQGLAKTMLFMLIEQAKEMGVTEITLDATEQGRSLYQKFGFTESREGMVLDLKLLLQKNIDRVEKYGCQTHSCCTCH